MQTKQLQVSVSLDVARANVTKFYAEAFGSQRAAEEYVAELAPHEIMRDHGDLIKVAIVEGRKLLVGRPG